ncbi:hypothetical protein HRR83_002460 [Exophiala dermatitidis]|uniref:Uncharacterized protein n=2 Tax=Exophiala dermatitidis TaxID=5970 RepID=H6C0T3_EXODN|nr:uncharacterized protein HMPREF1120_04539 [Exophiala dermatitidis NIH/UT8656]KAJ4520458.1 hypothetical protein HRR75_002324 [Exophiala dermatitidis]EHY56457.1 hypothetical protein HMPREF1120_04539 [Exophiala dermatitidis NIH/UT8656]KAJ4524339.1 hypothetical protein HRR74_002537 [Exophiala dermatitidis]KAJ4525388.1 hypothetical protein HRR73_002117 [Exophiala dermatitidis]KAJ4536702.1 hypothetical protein HRR76_004729 [Exophiala dermatitidis]
MLQLSKLPKSITGDIDKSCPTPASHRRGFSVDSIAGDGLLSPVGALRPRWGHRRQLSLSSLQSRRAICLGIAILFFVFTGLLWSIPQLSKVVQKNAQQGPIPIGQSRYPDGKEVFWWEQFNRLQGFYHGRKNIVPFTQYVPEQQSDRTDLFDGGPRSDPQLVDVSSGSAPTIDACYIDQERKIAPPKISAYQGMPQGMPVPLFGSAKELGLNDQVCYDRVNRYGPYGLGISADHGGLGVSMEGDNEGLDRVPVVDWRNVNWHAAQEQCLDKNKERLKSRTAFVIRTWNTHQYTAYEIMMLRALISELALLSGGQYRVHFLIHVQDDTIPIWASQDIYNQTLKDSLPEAFRGMGVLWSEAQMKLIYPPPFPESIVNLSGKDIYGAYRSLHFPMQYFASLHSEYDYFWHWEMDIRITGHYHELIHRLTAWAEKQAQEYAGERSSKFYIPSLHHDSYENYAQSIVEEVKAANRTPVSGPQLPSERLFQIPAQQNPLGSDHITDFITLNPLFDPTHTHWAFHNDITGYNLTTEGRPPTRAALITASRMSRRLLLLMHEETYRNKHTMFPEMYPASIALHYGLKAISVPLPVYFDRDWPPVHADEVFNNAPLSEASKKAGMDHGGGYFHGENGSVFGPGEHVFRGSTYYSNAAFAGYLWRRWLGRENEDVDDEVQSGRMCLPIMVLHPIKSE